MKQFDTDVLKEEQGWQGQQATEQEEGTDGRLKDTDDPFVSTQEDMLGKRARTDSQPKVDRTVRSKTDHV